MYNPFVIFTEEVLSALQNDGMAYLIIQRYSWPGLSRDITFLVTPYANKEMAVEHEQNLQHNEGKLLSISVDRDKILNLLNPVNDYLVFLSIFKETNWNKRMLKEYEQTIVAYLRTRTYFTRQDAIDINFTLKFGRLIAEIRATGKSLDLPALELIK